MTWNTKNLRCFIAVTFCLISLPLLAQGVDDPNGVFQLEGNATKDASICFPSLAAPPCSGSDKLVTFGANTDDWSNLAHALATTGIIADVSGKGDTILTGGGTKDINDFSQWQWKQNSTTSVQAKDDITHAYAAAYQLANGHTAIIFGMDRFDNSGDATAGFWFLQDSTVSTNPNGTFNGHHMDGDLLIVSDFSTGGATSTINIFKWVGGANGSLVLNESRSPAPCDPTQGTSDLCAIVNPVDGVPSPWGFVNKSGETAFAHGEFLEGGIDLQSVFGSNIPCFTTFMAETRSSTSPTSTLSDFTGPHSFPLCGLSVSKACNGPGQISADGTSVSYTWTATVTNTGIGTLTNVTLADTFPDGTQQNIPVTNSLSAGASASVTVTFVATNANCHAGVPNCPSPLDATNTATAFASAPGGNTINSSGPPATAECITSVSSSVGITKACDTSKGGATLVQQNGQLVVEVFFTAQVCNNGNVQLTNITLGDDPAATIVPSTISQLNPGQCQTVSGNYFPSSPAGGCNFSDTVRVTGATATLGDPPKPVAGCPGPNDLACSPVTCPLCH
jgi:uncharacterized repeat protein (TIGR01451 family)